MKFDTTDLCYRGKPLDAVNLEIRLLVAEDLGNSILLKIPGMAWRTKNWSQPMPSGVLMTEHARLLIGSMSQAPTDS